MIDRVKTAVPSDSAAHPATNAVEMPIGGLGDDVPTGSGDNTLMLNALDMFRMSGNPGGGIAHLSMYGDAGGGAGTLDAGSANMAGTVIGTDTFAVFQKGQAQLIIDSDTTIAGIPFLSQSCCVSRDQFALWHFLCVRAKTLGNRVKRRVADRRAIRCSAAKFLDDIQGHNSRAMVTGWRSD